MRQPLIVGLGRSGAGLHLQALHTARTRSPAVWTGPVVAVDPRPDASAPAPGRVTVTRSLEEARPLLSPAATVVHVCTPPTARLGLLAELAAQGYRDIVVEKPLAADAGELAAVERLRSRHGLRITVVAHWQASELARRLRAVTASGELGRLLRINVAQHKPRFARSLRPDDGHPTAFDVEVPHSLGLVLELAGPAETTGARLTDLRAGETVRPRMGSALLELRHTGGVRTRIVSDLTAPVRERNVTLTFRHGTAVGHFAPSDADDHVQLAVGDRREVFRDDALAAFMLRTYNRYATTAHDDPSWDAGFALHAGAVRLLDAAKRHCAEASAAGGSREEAVRAL
ncbi:Gfo/Idh/MocA family oxidoreductase [Streptomyces nitrosporeus]|uniref:Gfo/Idh/MocA family oxidoreductase n=1 Tax=Streptomyces nitrosporeus TaxID=28894 RepID=UPI00331C0038